jgi:hypothetical protein
MRPAIPIVVLVLDAWLCTETVVLPGPVDGVRVVDRSRVAEVRLAGGAINVHPITPGVPDLEQLHLVAELPVPSQPPVGLPT